MIVKTGRPSVLWQVCSAHFVSHVYIMLIPSLLPILPNLMQVNFLQLGVALAVFGVVSAVVQAPLGFLTDRWGARRLLGVALLLGAAGFGLLAMQPSYPVLLGVMAVAGVANGVYHPADYALLSRCITSARMGRAFSLHTFFGFLGAALTPLVMVGVAQRAGLNMALWLASGVGLAALLILAGGQSAHALGEEEIAPTKTNRAPRRPLRIEVSTVAVLIVLFALLSLSTGAIEKFSVSALTYGLAVPLSVANTALTGFLMASAVGVLAGGFLADRTDQHGVLAGLAFAGAALLVVIVITLPLPAWILIAVLTMTGFLTGVVAPSRDMLVRAASPKGKEGHTFGLVSTGFSVGAIAGPVGFGWLIDQHLPLMVLWSAVGFMVLTTVVVLWQEYREKSLLSNAKSGLA